MNPVIRPRSLFIALSLLLAFALWLSLALGPVSLPLLDTLKAALRLLGLAQPGDDLAQAELILGQIRLPRTLLGLLVGAVLALCGVAMQGLFRNPLADPGLIGVSSGAALGASIAIVGGAALGGLPEAFAPYLLSLFAFIGGLGVTALVYRLGRRDGETNVATMLLAGIALMLGYRLKENFDNPYAASNITVFWRKWHISLSSWLRDYIYIPLGGNRKGEFNTYLFLLITMLVGGFWHGADWRFVFWGLAHGLALAFHKAWLQLFPSKSNPWYSRIFSTILTFHFVGFCWIFFRASSFGSAFASIEQIAFHTQWKDFVGFWTSRQEMGIMIMTAAFIAFFPPNLKERIFQKIQWLPTFTWILWVLISLQIIIQFKDDVVQPFIYFQF